MIKLGIQNNRYDDLFILHEKYVAHARKLKNRQREKCQGHKVSGTMPKKVTRNKIQIKAQMKYFPKAVKSFLVLAFKHIII